VTLVRRALAEVRTVPVLLVIHRLGASMAGDGLDWIGYVRSRCSIFVVE